MEKDADTSSQSTIKAFIQRFREAPPSAPSSGRRLPQRNGDFWWISKESSHQDNSAFHHDDPSINSEEEEEFDMESIIDRRQKHFDEKTKTLLDKCDMLLQAHPDDLRVSDVRKPDIYDTCDSPLTELKSDGDDDELHSDVVLPWVSLDVLHPGSAVSCSLSTTAVENKTKRNAHTIKVAEKYKSSGSSVDDSPNGEEEGGGKKECSLSLESASVLHRSDDLFAFLSSPPSPSSLVASRDKSTASVRDTSYEDEDLLADQLNISESFLQHFYPISAEEVCEEAIEVETRSSDIVITVDAKVKEDHHVCYAEVEPYLADDIVSSLWSRLLAVRCRIDSSKQQESQQQEP